MVPLMVSFPTVGTLVCHHLLRLVETLLSQVFPAANFARRGARAVVLVVAKLLTAEAAEGLGRVRV